jgi:hypothetical protein
LLHPHQAERFEARYPKDADMLAEVTGEVSFSKAVQVNVQIGS